MSKHLLKAYSILASITLILGLSSCEKLLLGSDPASDPVEVFDHIWEDIHNRYSYFELKNIDWIEVKNRYQNRIQNGMSELELFEVISQMLFELQDGHVNLSSPFNRSRNWNWFQDHPINYNQNIIDQNYLGKDFWVTGPLRHQILDEVLYINYRTFTEQISDANLEEVIKRAQGTSGVIIDVRSNGGGNLLNAEKLAGAFTSTDYSYGRVRIKTGPCIDCFSPWTDLRVPAKNGLIFNGDVVVLTNRGSYSTTTYFAEMMRTNPRATLIGDMTGGGGGTPAFGELPNGWFYRFSSTQAVDPEGRHFELGTPVDIYEEISKEDEERGIDTILEVALELLRR